MRAYLDTSAWIAWQYGQKGSEIFERISVKRDLVFSSTLLVSEYAAFLKGRSELESTRFEDELNFVRWVYPPEPLYKECSKALSKGKLRGADLHHVATALWLAGATTGDVHFLTCDERQREVALELGFKFR